MSGASAREKNAANNNASSSRVLRDNRSISKNSNQNSQTGSIGKKKLFSRLGKGPSAQNKAKNLANPNYLAKFMGSEHLNAQASRQQQSIMQLKLQQKSLSRGGASNYQRPKSVLVTSPKH